MLTKEEIEIQSKEVYSLKAYKDYARAYALGATWANETLSAQIAELRAVNSEQADKIVDLQARREEHMRTIAELMGEKAELKKTLEEIYFLLCDGKNGEAKNLADRTLSKLEK